MKQVEEKAERDRILRVIEENKNIELQQKAKRKQQSLQYQQGLPPNLLIMLLTLVWCSLF